MAGTGSLATTAIITKGLTCGHGPLDPCKTGLITTAFSLYCTTPFVPPEPKPTITGGGGGPYPRDAWNKFNPGEIQDFYQPVPPEQQYYVVPREKEAEYFRRHKKITLNFKMGDFQVEKEYSVPEQKLRVIVKAFGMVEATKDRIDVGVKNIKRIVTDIVVAAKNLRLKK